MASHRLDHHAAGSGRVWSRSFPGLPVEAGGPADVFAGGVPVSVQAGRATATVPPPSSSLREAARVLGDVSKNAGRAAVVVLVGCAEAKAILVNAGIFPTDGITYGETGRDEERVHQFYFTLDYIDFQSIHHL